MSKTNFKKCPICDFDLIEPKIPGPDLKSFFRCPHCGEFSLTYEALQDLPIYFKKHPGLNAKLSHTVQKTQSIEEYWVSLDLDKINKVIETVVLPSPQEQAEYLLLWLGKNIPGPGEDVKVTWEKHGAIIGAKSYAGFLFIIINLKELGFVEVRRSASVSTPEAETIFYLTLSFPGWNKYQELQRGISHSRKAFMAMPYGKNEIDNMVDNHFRNAVKEAGFELFRLDDEPKAGLIDDRLRVEIKTSRFLIADLTYDNSGAYWEAGYAEGLGKPVIYTCEKNHFEKNKPHFDTNHHLTVPWDENDPLDAVEMLKATIRATLPDAKMD